MASISSGVGGPWGLGDVTIYMKRIENSLLGRAAGHAPAELSRYSRRRSSPGRIDMGFEK
jgi:hypothetical protein